MLRDLKGGQILNLCELLHLEVRFPYIAKASCGETRSHLFMASDQDYLTKDELEKTKSFAKSVSGMIGGFISYLRGSKMKVEKFKQKL